MPVHLFQVNKFKWKRFVNFAGV